MSSDKNISKKSISSTSKNINDHWSRHAIVYQIYPLSFKDSSGDGRGDLEGIIEKLDYLQKPGKSTTSAYEHGESLGINTVWISPFFRSPMADFGYDIENYTDVDPIFGDTKTFDRLVSELKKRKVRLIVDFVGNHTAAKHQWFVDSKSSRNNPKRDWYIWKDPNADGGPPNNWASFFGGSAWEFDQNTGQYFFHTFLKEQPDLNWYNPEVRAEMMRILDFWISKGVDGFRVDALQHFLEDSSLRDEIPDPNTDDPYKSLVHRFNLDIGAKNNVVGSFFTEVLEKHPDLFIVGEVYVGLNDLIKFYDLVPNGRFMPFNFNLIDIKWSASSFKHLIDEYQSKLKPEYLANYVLGNHDVMRIATRIGITKAHIIAFLQYTLPGVPFVYYGDEIGMENGTIPPNAIKDVLAKMFPGLNKGRDLERTPMQWDESENAGFTDGKPWLPVAHNYKTINVSNQEKDENSTLSLYKALIRLRKNSETLKIGKYVPRKSSSPAIFSFERHHNGERLLVLVNFSENIEREIIHPSKGRESKIIFSTNTRKPAHNSSKIVELLPNEACVICL